MNSRRAATRLAAITVLAALAMVSPPTVPASPVTGHDGDSPLVATVSTDEYPEVHAIVTVPPELAETKLTAASFEVVENGNTIDEVVVEPIDGNSLQVVLAVDTSGSMAGEALELAKQAATEFGLAMPAGTEIGVVSFAEESVVVAPFTADASEIVAAIDGLQAGGETALNDAVMTSLSLFASDVDARQSVVLLTDGGDTLSEVTTEAAIGAIEQSTTAFYAVALVTDETDIDALTDLVGTSSGQLVRAEDPLALAGAYETIAAELTSQYRVSWIGLGELETEIRISITAPDGEAVSTAQVGVEYPVPGEGADASGSAVGEPGRVGTEPTETSADNAEAAATGQGAASPDQKWKLLAGLAAVGLALFVGFASLLRPRYRTRKLVAERSSDSSTGRNLSGVGNRVVNLSSGALRRTGDDRRLRIVLDRAGWSINPGELVTAAVAVGVLLGLLGFFIGGIVAGMAWPAAALAALVVGLHLAARRRCALFATQLEPTLQMLIGSLRAGYGITQAATTVGDEADEPIAVEFRRALRETQLGKDFAQALRDVAVRMGSDDLTWVADAIEINRAVGGNLVEVLENVADTIKRRSKLARQVKILSAEGRMSGAILLLLPVGVFVWISFSNPTYMSYLTNNTVGLAVLGAGALSMALGALWISRIVRIEY